MATHFSMKRLIKVFMVLLLVFYFQTGSAFAQIGSGVSVGFNLISAVARGSRARKQEKLIEQSSKQEKIAGSNVTVLRVKESEINSKAKKNIIALQKRLDQYGIQYKNNQPLEISKNDSDLITIQNIDENWPSENYSSELRAYKRYAFQLKQKMAAVPVNSLSNSTSDVKEKTDTASVKQ